MKLPDNCPKIKLGQYWKKKDTGQLVQITGRRGIYYATRKVGGSYKTHGVKAEDLWRFWEQVSIIPSDRGHSFNKR